MEPNTQETLDLMKAALGQPMDNSTRRTLEKSVTIATGLTAYDLAAPAKNLYPTITPLRNKIPRKMVTNPGDIAHWRSIFGITGSGYDSMGYVPEGQRSGSMSYSVTPKTATYITIGEENDVTFEAAAAGEGFEDVNATAKFRMLQKMMRKEELMILLGNSTVALGTPTTPTASNAATGGTVPDQVNSVIVVALTGEGYKNSSVAAGVATSKTITGNDGSTYTLNGGSSNKSAATTTTTSGGNLSTLSATVPVVAGAVAYAWYVGLAGAETLQAITTINSVKLLALTTTGQNASAITSDHSRNATLACDGLLTNALNSANNNTITTQATGTAGTGTPLTANGFGGIVEFDTYLQTMWNSLNVTPTVIYVNAQELRNITAKIANSNTPILRYNLDGKTGAGGFAIVANGRVMAYHNPYTVDDNGTDIPIKVHPDVPPGTILFHTEKLPVWFQQSNITEVAELLLRRDYYGIDWPITTRKRFFGIYAEEVLAINYPQAIGCITNLGNG